MKNKDVAKWAMLLIFVAVVLIIIYLAHALDISATAKREVEMMDASTEKAALMKEVNWQLFGYCAWLICTLVFGGVIEWGLFKYLTYENPQKCPNCNMELDDETPFCPYCGFDMTTPKAAEEPETAAPERVKSKKISNPSQNKKEEK